MGCLVRYHPVTATVTCSGTRSPRIYW
jgi:hypothetical protein